MTVVSDCTLTDHMFIPQRERGMVDITHVLFTVSQDQVSKEELLSALYLEFVNRVNEVGVDINRCIAFPHTASLLQFVCGLGPRKASYLLKVKFWCPTC